MSLAPNRRWFQWSLRTLFVVVTLAALLGFVIVTQRRSRQLEAENARLRAIIVEQKEAMKDLEADGPQKLRDLFLVPPKRRTANR